jgi:hypothetical protein
VEPEHADGSRPQPRVQWLRVLRLWASSTNRGFDNLRSRPAEAPAPAGVYSGLVAENLTPTSLSNLVGADIQTRMCAHDRLAALLSRLPFVLKPLSRLLLAAALQVPLGVWFDHTFISHPRLEWAKTNWYSMPGEIGIRERWGMRHGFSLTLTNEGNATTGAVRVELLFTPEFLDVIGNWSTYPRLHADQDPWIIHVGPMEPGHAFHVFVYGFRADVAVLEDGQPVEETSFDWTIFFTAKAWFPNSAFYAGVLLLAALLVQNLSMRRRLSAALSV